MASASVSFGVIAYSVSSSPAESFEAGAGFRTTFLPSRYAIMAAASTVCIGISSCNRMISAASTASADRFRSLGVRCALAPGATTMQFSASVSTVIRATPDGFFVSENTYEVSIPSSLNSWLAWCPKMSLPVLQMKETLPPRRATVTAWLAPLPPGFMKKVPPMTVSPGRGKCPVQMTISVFELPITRIFDSDMCFYCVAVCPALPVCCTRQGGVVFNRYIRRFV